MNTFIQLTAFLVVVALSSSSIVKSPSAAANEDNFELLILHNNDMHARFEQTSQLSGTCTPADREAGKCYGGFPRVAYVVKEARRKAASGEGPPVLYLNAGDTYTGTAWFTIYKWKVAAEFINALQPDAVSLGNHEFDEGVEGVVPFIRNLTTPVLAANLILDKVPELKTETNLYKTIVLNVEGNKIGIIGYLTPETKYLAPRNKVEYEDEVVAIKREVDILKNKGINIIIALGHSGFYKDLEIAKNVPDLDIVIGGHSNTFLYNGRKTEERPETSQGPYPTIIKQSTGKPVLVVQAYAYTKYMGQLYLKFDTKGEIVDYDGSPLLLNQEVPKDPELLEIIKRYRSNIDILNSEIIGVSSVFLDGDCRLRECNLGDLITDAVLNYTRRYYDEYSDVFIAVVQGGRIRASIDQPEKPFNLTRNDWITVLPFSDPLSIVTINGTILKHMLEHSVSTWRLIDSTGQFLQFSGMKVLYDLGKPPGSRVVSAKAICTKCRPDELKDIKDDYEYKVFMPTFLAEAGDGFTMFEGHSIEQVKYTELECVLDYIRNYGPINYQVNGRLTINNEDKISNEKLDSLIASRAFVHLLDVNVYCIIALLISYYL
ncbi:protein 5NUC-like isoform 2-T2 [Aphomia sociella]